MKTQYLAILRWSHVSMFKLIFLLLIVFGLSACTKCVTCSATWTDPVDTTNTQLINSYEYCGNKKDVKNFEAEWKAQYMDAIYSDVVCE